MQVLNKEVIRFGYFICYIFRYILTNCFLDPECQSGVGKLKCPTVTSASPSTVPPTSTTRPSVNDTEGKCSDGADNQGE